MAIRRKNIAGLSSDAISPCVPRFRVRTTQARRLELSSEMTFSRVAI